MKVIAERAPDGRAGRIIGVHMAGPWVTEQLGQGYLAVNWEATPDDVARLDKNLIYGIHICDGQRRVPGTLWDEGALRGFLPGEGDLPVADWVAAVKAIVGG